MIFTSFSEAVDLTVFDSDFTFFEAEDLLFDLTGGLRIGNDTLQISRQTEDFSLRTILEATGDGYEVSGSGLSDFDVAGGTVRYVSVDHPATGAFEIGGLDVSLATLFSRLEQGDAFAASLVAGDDEFYGTNFDDVLTAGPGNDRITGGLGDDTIDGGTGTDSAVFGSAFADYKITHRSNGSVTVKDRVGSEADIEEQISGVGVSSFILTPELPEGTDTVTNVETLVFTDGSYNIGTRLFSETVETTETIPARPADTGDGITLRTTGDMLSLVNGTPADDTLAAFVLTPFASTLAMNGPEIGRGGQYQFGGTGLTFTGTPEPGAIGLTGGTVMTASINPAPFTPVDGDFLYTPGLNFSMEKPETASFEAGGISASAEDFGALLDQNSLSAVVAFLTDGNNTVTGSGRLAGGAGNDLLQSGASDDVLDGGTGIDTAAFSSALASFTFYEVEDGVVVFNTASSETDVLYRVEYLQFADMTITVAEALALDDEDEEDGDDDDDTDGDDADDNDTDDDDDDDNTSREPERSSKNPDPIEGGDDDDTLQGDTGNDRISGGAGNDRLDGGEGKDILMGGDGNDRLDGGAGKDRLAGGAGDDTYIKGKGDKIEEEVGGGTDTVISAGSVKLRDNVENVVLTGADKAKVKGNDQDNEITGNDGNNKIAGRDGDDTLDGGDGADRMVGGPGSDIFVFQALSATDVDQIKGFDATEDRIDLSAIDGLDSVQDVVDRLEQDGKSVVFTHEDNGAQLFIQKTQLEELSEEVFILT